MIRAMILFFCAGVVTAAVKFLFWIAGKDEDMPYPALKITLRLYLTCLVSAEMVFLCGERWLERLAASLPVRGVETGASTSVMLILELWVCTLLGLLAGCLIMACVTDCLNCMVYTYVWWIGGLAGVCFWMTSCQSNSYCSAEDTQKVLACLLWGALRIVAIGFLQEAVFGRMYGRADCHAFFVCGIAECAMDLGIREHLLQMLIAVSFLAVVQGVQGNILRNGNLKRGVPFLPYVTISFWCVMLTL